MSFEQSDLRVGYVLRKFPVLSETFILNEILALESTGVDITIFSLTRPNVPRFHEDLPKLKATIYYVPEILQPGDLFKYRERASRRFNYQYRRTLRYVLSQGNPALLWRFLQSCYVSEKAGHHRLNHLHAHFATRATTVALLASMISGVPHSFTAHAFDIFRKEYSTRTLSKKIQGARFTVAISDFNKTYLQRLAPQKGEDIVRIYNGIDLTRFSPNGAVPLQPFTILCVARLVEKKGHINLIEACSHLRDRGLSFRCWLVGTGHLKKDLAKMIHQLDLSKQVLLLGAHTQLEVLERYRSANVFVLPCRVDSEGNQDGLPVSIVEALACGLPVVTTPVTGIPELVRDHENGLLVEPNNPVELSNAIESLLSDVHLYQRMSSNARNSVTGKFDISQTSTALKKLFERSAQTVFMGEL